MPEKSSAALAIETKTAAKAVFVCEGCLPLYSLLLVFARYLRLPFSGLAWPSLALYCSSRYAARHLLGKQ